MTLSPKSGRIVRPTKIVTLRPQKVGRSVTAEHYDPVVFLVSTVCDIMSQIPPTSLAFSSLVLASGCFSNCSALLKSSCVPHVLATGRRKPHSFLSVIATRHFFYIEQLKRQLSYFASINFLKEFLRTRVQLYNDIFGLNLKCITLFSDISLREDFQHRSGEKGRRLLNQQHAVSYINFFCSSSIF
jgi:hypothetical protein